MANPIQQAQQLGQSVWLDYIRRGLLKSGELKELTYLGLSGLTANPTILEKAIVGSTDYDDALAILARTGKSNEEIYEALAIEDIRAAADLMRPIYDRTGGADGYPSLEISPLVAYDTDKTIEEARRLFTALARPNVMVKVPATPQGIPAIRQLTGEGINVNVTLIFSLEYYEKVMEAYIAGLEDLTRSGGDPRTVVSVASFFLSRIDTAVDNLLEEQIKQGQAQAGNLLGKTAIASARVAYKRFKDTFYGQRFKKLQTKGTNVQRVLWASTGTKNPAYSDLTYVEPLIGPDTVNTMPLATLHAFLDHGRVEATIEKGISEAERTLATLSTAGIDLKAVTDKLLADGVKAFSDSFEKLMSGIEEKKTRLLASEVRIATNIGKYEADVKATLADLGKADIVRRIWRKDYTVWKPDPTEIADRLGWLSVTDVMQEQVPMLQSFAREVRDAGFRYVVLLGMGGSSLCAEVLRQVFGSAEGYPQLIVLDSTVPESVKAVPDSMSPACSLFLVSSKSGTTTEPLILYSYFRSLVDNAVGKRNAGQSFVAITDGGTPLVTLAEKEGFRHTFLNPADIGGRYSVLSYFGLVPAALIGLDIKALLERADSMREGCASCVPEPQNHGSWLGACLGACAPKSRDKLTLVTSPSIASLGLWLEQLIAESLGKDSKGIIPVANEPLVKPAHYGSDRFFVYLRVKDDQNQATDAAVNSIVASGQPVVVLEVRDKYDLGGEFFRWEFATAVAGAVLGIHPFNQPDVQRAKEATDRFLKEHSTSGRSPKMENNGSLADLLKNAGEGKYLGIMAYLHQTPEMDAALAGLRQKIVERYHMATTLGYGPRYLHSTGQLYKGGRNSGLFLQLTSGHKEDLPIPGRHYTFGLVADAQALGDFQALQAGGRQVVRIHLPKSDPSLVAKLSNELA
ncbi:MAG: bifunctional transaldolase/phosoglucose isomerase [Chloroflexi bacterium]|nr:bifunctional transaldolase/phosoglucose isomerase [Chloroflexota bacterium]